MTTSQHFIRNSWKLLMKTNDFPCVREFTLERTGPATNSAVSSAPLQLKNWTSTREKPAHVIQEAAGERAGYLPAMTMWRKYTINKHYG